MGTVPSPISRIRTFREDVNRLQTKNAPRAAVTREAPKTIPPPPRSEVRKTVPVVRVTPTVSMVAPANKATVLPKIDREKVPAAPTIIPPATAPKLNEKLTNDLSAVGAVKPRSILSQEDRVFDVMEADDYKREGSIITDRKRKHFKLLPAMVEALKGWFLGQRETISKLTERKEAPVATIRPAKTREEILSKAFRQNAMAPKNDYENLTARLRETIKQRPSNASSGTLTIKKAAEMEAPSWTHMESEVVEATAESGTVPQVEETTAEATPAVAEETRAIYEPIEAPASVVIEPEFQSEPGPPAPSLVEVPPAEELESAPEPEPDLTPLPYRAPLSARARAEVAPFSPWRVGAVALLAILLGVSGTLWFFGGGEDGEVVVNKNEVPSLISAEEQIAVPLGRDAQSLLRSILAVRPRETSVVAQVYPETNLAGDTIPAGAAEILSVIDPRAPGTFTRAVTAINFGIYRKREPFMILRLTSFDTALGGMLAWEESMSADLSPLFGAPVAGTFDPQARTATQIREPYFDDALVGNYDARLLLDETQKERLIYAFVNRNTVVITTNRDALLSLAALIK